MYITALLALKIFQTFEFNNKNLTITTKTGIRTNKKQNLKGSDDGVFHSESLGIWTLSIVRNSK
jgi:hypothetical protein